MGRFYSGDINGQFWFTVQESDCADRFGVTGQPNFLVYNFEEENLESIEEEIKNIEESLGDQLQVIKRFFENNTGYNNKMLKEAAITTDQLRDYADLSLGKQIRDCIKENGSCRFDAEL